MGKDSAAMKPLPLLLSSKPDNDEKKKTDGVSDLHHEFAEMVGELRSTFRTGKTKPLEWRKQQLRQIRKMIQENIDAIQKAIQEDLGGPRIRTTFEMSAAEEAQLALDSLDKWAADERVPDANAFGKSVIRREPKGVVLIIAPWNFPITLSLQPLVSVLAAGNCAVLKPSEVSTNASKLLAEMIPKYLPSDAVRVVTGGVPETTALLACQYDHILYTGNGAVARIVMKAAAQNLTPVTLELGGKSPVIIDETAKIGLAAKRLNIVKFCSNAGQICISPDYVLVERSKKDEFLAALCAEVKATVGSTREELCGKDEDVALGRIINDRHVGRIRSLLESSGGNVVHGNPKDIDESTCHVPPIIVADPTLDSKIMKEEIFGPVLPVVTFDTLDEAIEKANAICEHPLALYVFSESNKNIEKVLRGCTSGGAAVNSAVEQILNPNLPFGGVGESGMGAYHGKFGFDEFSHKRSILYRTTLLPVTLLPPPSKGRFPRFLFKVAVKMGVFGWEKTLGHVAKSGIMVVLAAVILRAMMTGGMLSS